jgi:indole-3-glycerol phosphate synthase
MQGGFENLTLIRQAGVQCPLLCKEFIVEVRSLAMWHPGGALV